MKRTVPVSNQSKIDSYSEDLNKYIPNYEYTVTETAPIAKTNDQVFEDPSNNTFEINKAIDTIRLTNNNKTEATGYRILVFSGNSKAEFNEARNYLLSNYSFLEHYESYQQPTYKLKIGDFSSKLLAEKYYGELVERFSMATIITDKIDVKKSLLN